MARRARMQRPIQSYFRHVNEQIARFELLLAQFPALQQMAQQGELKLQGFHNIVCDIWLAFYCPAKVSLLEGEDFHVSFVNEMLRSDQYANWCRFTEYDDLLALITTLSIVENVLKELDRQERFKQMAQKMGNTRQGQKLFTKSFNMNALIEKSKTSTKKTKETLVQLHGLEGKKIDEIPLREQLALANTLQCNDHIKKIAELTGKFKRIALKKFKTKQKNMMQRQDVTLGQEIARLLPIELASFVMPQSKLAFYRKFVEHETMIFDQKGKDTSGRGPIIICMDESSSMSFLKEESKAFCLALLFIAKKQKRDFAIIPFATNVGDVSIFEKGQANVDDITKFATSFLGGGTNYEKALNEALQILNNSKFKQADILFVTDGTSFLSKGFLDDYNETKRKRAFTCTSIVLTNLNNSVDINLVEKFSDRVIVANDLFSADQVFNVLL